MADIPSRSWTLKPLHAGNWWRAVQTKDRIHVTLEQVRPHPVSRSILVYGGNKPIEADPNVIWSPANVPQPSRELFAAR